MGWLGYVRNLIAVLSYNLTKSQTRWMMPSPIGPGTPAPETTASGSGSRPTLTHAEMLLKRLKSDPEVIKVDPTITSAKERYEKYLADIDTDDARWTARIREVVAETSEDSDALLATKEKLGRCPALYVELRAVDHG